jgi:predicted MPP superfamily phosphohydrolase
MVFIAILILTEIFTPVVLGHHFFNQSRTKYFISIVIHAIMSIWLWFLIIEIESDKGFYDTPRHIWLLMNLRGMIVAVIFPRVLIVVTHFTGRLIKIKQSGHIRWLTNTGLIAGFVIFSVIGISTLHTRFNFKTENVTIQIKGLSKELNGLKIAQVSDMHLASFYHHRKMLVKVVDDINAWKPDLIFNTGDFVSFGWREFGKADTILAKSVSRLGNFAVLGNHDNGTYHPYFTEADRENNILIMINQVKSSGYQVITNNNFIIQSGRARIGILGVTTTGRHPDIKHGDVKLALAGLDSVDLKILLSHDPNQWKTDVAGKTDIGLTLSGHTHAMQFGIYTKWFRWSPSKYFYPHWNGLFSEGNQYHYVNRGMGLLAVPFRIWMPPEITFITLESI